jgi:predicted secreted protein
MVVVDEQQSGTGVDVPAGQLLAIRLKENAGTGFRWTVEDAGGLTPADHVDRGGAPGAAGFREFRFRAGAPGGHRLVLRQWRDWEGESSIIGRFVLDVRFL